MKSKKEKLKFLPQNAYFISALIFVNKKGEILLVKERKSNSWLPPGGEICYREKEQFLDCAFRETIEEVGLKVKKEPELVDLTISYPEGDNPYKKEKISLVIATYIAEFPRGQKIKLRRSFGPIEREYDVKEYLWISPQEIIKKKLKLPQYFVKNVIPKIKYWIEKYGEK